jgi:hypothetical protein
MHVRRRALKEGVWPVLSERACVDWGERDPLVLEFDHFDPATKLDGNYSLVQSGYGWQSVLDEIAKCQLRCSNCHRRRSCVQFSWADRRNVNGLAAYFGQLLSHGAGAAARDLGRPSLVRYVWACQAAGHVLRHQ